MSNLLTIKQVAEKLQVHPNTISKWIAAGKVAPIKLPGGDVRFREDWLENWLNTKTVKAKIK